MSVDPTAGKWHHSRANPYANEGATLDELALRVDERDGRPLHRQLYDGVRAAILTGRLRPGQRVPATRQLAGSLGLARNTVARAYDDLLAEGYLRGRRGSGTYVAAGFGAARPAVAQAEAPAPAESAAPVGPAPPFRLSSWARRALDRGRPDPLPAALPYDFRPGTPDWEAFPHAVWRRLLGRRLRAGTALRRYGDPAGYPPLREAIARHVAASRAVACRAEQVVIVNGAQQAVDLVARLLVEPGDAVVVEDPGYPEARRVFAAYGAALRPVPVDGDGLRVDALPGGSARLVYVTPSHQYPTGATLPLERRLALLSWAAAHGALVVEDDYDSEFRHAGRPVESLQGLDGGRSVLYVGTFSSVLFPPLRVGYLVLPPDLVEPFASAKWLADRGTGALEQGALAEFMAEGHFARHLRRMRRLGRARRDALLAALARHVRPARLPAADTGLHAMLDLPGLDEAAVVAAARARGVAVYPAGPCYAEPAHARPGLLLGYGALPEDAIEEGVRRLGDALRSLR